MHSYTPPCAMRLDLSNGLPSQSNLLGNLLVGSAVLSDRSRLGGRNLGAPALLSLIAVAVADLVLAVFLLCSPKKVLKMIVGFFVVPVPTYMGGRGARTNKGLQNQDVDASHLGLAVAPKINSHVTRLHGDQLEKFGRCLTHAVSSPDNLLQRTNAPDVADLVNTLVTDDGQPNFIHVRPPIANVPCEECVAAARNTAVRSNPSHAGQLYGI